MKKEKLAKNNDFKIETGPTALKSKRGIQR